MYVCTTHMTKNMYSCIINNPSAIYCGNDDRMQYESIKVFGTSEESPPNNINQSKYYTCIFVSLFFRTHHSKPLTLLPCSELWTPSLQTAYRVLTLSRHGWTSDSFLFSLTCPIASWFTSVRWTSPVQATRKCKEWHQYMLWKMILVLTVDSMYFSLN